VQELTIKNKEIKDGLGMQLSENYQLRTQIKEISEKLAKS